MKATKEIDCTLEAASMKDGATGQQYRRFLPHRTAMAESKAFMRAIRAALGLAGTYKLPDLKKPFIVARVVPNLDAPEIKQAVAGSYLQSMGLLFETPAAPAPAAAPAAAAAKDVNVPDIGSDEVEVTEILVIVGDKVEAEQSLITVEGDKASMEVPSPQAGIVKEIKVSVGDKTQTGALIMIFDSADGAADAAPAPS